MQCCSKGRELTIPILAMQELGRGLKSPSDPAKLSRGLLKITVEASLNAEMVHRIGYEKQSPGG
jgi:transposase-like protein